MGHGQAEVDDLRRNQARRARLAGPDGEPVVPEGAVGFVRSRRDLARFFEKDQAETVRRVITEGLEQGQSLKQVMGSLEKALPGKMGRARLENIARTEATTAYNQGRLAMFLDTEGFIAGVEFMAILDARTTDICRHRDGLVFRLDDPAIRLNTPPLHYQCRSILSPVPVTALKESDLERTRQRMATAPGPQSTKTGRFGNEPWPDVQGGDGAAPMPRAKPVGPKGGRGTSAQPGGAPGEEEKRKPADWSRSDEPPFETEEATRKSYREQAAQKQAEVATKKMAGTVTDADLLDAGETVAREVERRLEPRRVKIKQALEDRSQALNEDIRKIEERIFQEVESHPDYSRLDEETRQVLRRIEASESDGLTAYQVQALEDEHERLKTSMEFLAPASLRKQWTLAQEAISSLSDQIRDAQKIVSEVRLEVTTEVLSESRSIGGTFDFGTGSHRKGMESVSEASSLIPTDWISGSNRSSVPLKAVSRSKRPAYREDGTLDVGRSTSRRFRHSQAAHELGHRAEETVQGLLGLTLEFWQRRTAGESPEYLWKMHRGQGYKRWEKTRKDSFAHDYIGADYDGLGTEILATGLECIVSGRYNLWEDDPEHWAFTLGALLAW